MGSKPKTKIKQEIALPPLHNYHCIHEAGVGQQKSLSKNTCYSGEVHTKQKGSMVCAGAAGARETPTHVVARSEWQ